MPPLPGWERAVIGLDKLERFALAPDNPRSEDRWIGFALLGYDVDTEVGRRTGAIDLERQIRASLGRTEVVTEEDSPWGRRRHTRSGIVGPNGQRATLVLVWQYDGNGEVPRLITRWSRVHREDRP